MNTEKPSSEWETIYAYAVVNFLSQVNFCFSFVLEYWNMANEVETKEK